MKKPFQLMRRLSQTPYNLLLLQCIMPTRPPLYLIGSSNSKPPVLLSKYSNSKPLLLFPQCIPIISSIRRPQDSMRMKLAWLLVVQKHTRMVIKF